jgi:hypothetical protein
MAYERQSSQFLPQLVFFGGGVGQTQAWTPAFMLADDMRLENNGGIIY